MLLDFETSAVLVGVAIVTLLSVFALVNTNVR